MSPIFSAIAPGPGVFMAARIVLGLAVTFGLGLILIGAMSRSDTGGAMPGGRFVLIAVGLVLVLVGATALAVLWGIGGAS